MRRALPEAIEAAIEAARRLAAEATIEQAGASSSLVDLPTTTGKNIVQRERPVTKGLRHVGGRTGSWVRAVLRRVRVAARAHLVSRLVVVVEHVQLMRAQTPRKVFWRASCWRPTCARAGG